MSPGCIPERQGISGVFGPDAVGPRLFQHVNFTLVGAVDGIAKAPWWGMCGRVVVRHTSYLCRTTGRSIVVEGVPFQLILGVRFACGIDVNVDGEVACEPGDQPGVWVPIGSRHEEHQEYPADHRAADPRANIVE